MNAQPKNSLDETPVPGADTAESTRTDATTVPFDTTAPVCVVTGASQGFGLALAKRFAAGGYHLVLVARDAARLRQAAGAVTTAGNGTHVHTVATDVTTVAGSQTLAQALATLPRIEVLINAVGISDRGRADTLTPERVDELIRANLHSAMRTTQSLLAQVEAARGQVINIGSLASKFAPRWLGGYAVAKHALGAWTQQLRLELTARGVQVMLVCPGPIRRDEEGATRYQIAEDDLPAEALRPAGGAKLKGLDPERLADQVFRAHQRRVPEIVVPAKARVLLLLAAVAPRWADRLLMKMTS